MRQGLVHRREAVTHADDALAVAEGLIEGLSQCQREIFDGMVSIYFEIALGLHAKVEQSMHGEMRQHMIEKTDARGDVVFARSIQIEFDSDLRFIGLTGYFGGSHN